MPDGHRDRIFESCQSDADFLLAAERHNHRKDTEALLAERDRLRGLLKEARDVLDYFKEDSSEKYATEEGARWLLRYDAIVDALAREDY